MTALLSADLIEGRILDDEHRRLRAGLAALEEVIAEGHRLTRADAADHVAHVLAWLRRDLLPHAAWEEAWLYPRLDASTGSPWATRALRLEHQQIREAGVRLDTLFDEIHERWSGRVAFQLVAAFSRLDALVSAHLAQEERFVVPLLDDARIDSAHHLGGTLR